MIRIFLLLLISYQAVAQNLIPNPGFETISTPVKSRFAGNIEKAAPWFPAGVGSPDLIKPNDNINGKQASAEGSNYTGIILYDADNKDFREYLEVKLTSTLEAGREYCLRFKASAADDSWVFTDELGLKLTPDSVRSKDWNVIDEAPTFKTRRYETISDTSNWIDFEFIFTANGTERFLTIGNFRNDASTLIQSANKDVWLRLAYLYLDDFYLGKCNVNPNLTEPLDISPENPREFEQINITENGRPIIPNLLTPNGDGFNDVFVIGNLKRYCTLTIYNKAGSKVYISTNYTNDFTGSELPDGKYNYELRMPDGNLTFGSFDLFKKKKK
jgi:gliding motility-associated-like protein